MPAVSACRSATRARPPRARAPRPPRLSPSAQQPSREARATRIARPRRRSRHTARTHRPSAGLLIACLRVQRLPELRRLGREVRLLAPLLERATALLEEALRRLSVAG